MKKSRTKCEVLLLLPLFFGAWVCSSGAAASDFPASGFSPGEGITEADKREADYDRLVWSSGFESRVQVGSVWGLSYFSAPQTAWLTLEGKPKNKSLRALLKTKVIYDSQSRQTTFAADEAKLQMDLNKQVFLTAGLQKIKWGSGRIWNPTDVINTSLRNPFDREDVRSGVTLVKAHVPIESANLYGLTVFEQTTRPKQLGYAVRGEIPFAGKAELALTALSRGDEPLRIGADLSGAVGIVDLYGESLVTRGNLRGVNADSDEITLGVSYDFNVFEGDSATVGFEVYRNSTGLEQRESYALALAHGGLQSLHWAKQYYALLFRLPQPSNWNDWDFMLYDVMNGVDHSQYWRASVVWSGVRDLSVILDLGKGLGASDSEMAYGGSAWDASARIKISL